MSRGGGEGGIQSARYDKSDDHCEYFYRFLLSRHHVLRFVLDGFPDEVVAFPRGFLYPSCVKKSAYLPLEPFKGLISLLLKLISERKDTLLLVNKAERAAEISEMLWRSYHFVPHGLETEEFSQLQPILIATKPYQRSTVVILDGDEAMNFSGDALILWNKRPKAAGFTLYEQQPDLSWRTHIDKNY